MLFRDEFLLSLLAACLLGMSAQAANPLDFAKDVLPILERSCLPCHNATKSEADLMLETPQLMLKGGEKGPAIKPNHAAESLLYLTAAKQKKPYMPPAENKSKALPLSSQQLEILRRWIDEGAVGKGKAKQPVKWQAMPPVSRISSVSITQDGAVAAAARGNRVTLYDLSLPQVMAELPPDAHRDVVNALAFNPDGSLLATGSFGEVKLWKRALPTMKPATVKLGPSAFTEARSPDGKLMVSAPANAVARISSPDGKKVIAELRSDREQEERMARVDLALLAATFELSYQKEAQQKAEAQQKLFDEAAKRSATEQADFVKRKAEIETKVAEARKKRDELLKAREAADTALASALANKEAAEKLEAQGRETARLADQTKDKAAAADKPKAEQAWKEATAAAGKATQAREAAVKSLAEADKKQKEATTAFNEAVKTLSEAMSEVGKSVDAERSAKKAADDADKGKAGLEMLKQQVASAQTARDQAEKAQAAMRNAVPLVPSAFRGAAFTKDGAVIVSTHEDGKLRAWSAADGKALWTVAVDGKPLGLIQRQDDALLFAKGDGSISSLDLTPRWTLVRTIGDGTRTDSLLTDRVNALTFSADGKLLATGSGDPSRSGEIKLWDAATGRLVREIMKPHKDAVLALDFSSDGKQLASGGADRAVRLWDVATGRQLRNLEAHSNHVLSVSLRHDGRMLASAGADNSVRTWSLITGDVVKTISDFKKEVTSIHYTEQRSLLVATAGDPAVRLFTDEGGAVRADDKTFKGFLTSGCITPSGRVQVVGDVDGTLWVFSAEGELIKSFAPGN